MSKAVTNFRPSHFINRELSWLEFNQRVLDEALDPSTPLLEKLKFFCIVSSNLDEFFEVRVAGLKQEIESQSALREIDGRTPAEIFRAVTRRVRQLVEQQYVFFREELAPALAKNKIRFLTVGELSASDQSWLGAYFHERVLPVLTPMGLDPSHPFPQLYNKSLNLVVKLHGSVRGRKKDHLAVVPVPEILPRLVELPRKAVKSDFISLGQVIGDHLRDLFPGMEVQGYWRFRITRNSELYIDEEETANLLKEVEREVHNRNKGAAVRLELSHNCPQDIREFLLSILKLTADDLYLIRGPLHPKGFMSIYAGEHSPELRDLSFVAPKAVMLQNRTDLFAAIRERDILLHHPYESFESVVSFLEQAASDPDVLAIKQTLYRTGGDPRITGALMRAVHNGKQVTAVVELKARFDEEANIRWSRQLEEAGVHVVYGIVGFKIHCKCTLVVRSEAEGLRRYVHLATGNYNPTTAKLYTDLGLLTCSPGFGEDATNLFNLLTGICQYQGMKKFLVAPFELKKQMLAMIRNEADNAAKGLPARIVAKMNAIVDQDIIEALYRASQAGVQIDLIVRGICCLRAQVPGLSENIRVRSIIDRFLEHSRIFYFENACQPRVFMGSADWMPRNLVRRIEVVFPIEDGNIRDRIINEILTVSLNDNVKARQLNASNAYIREVPQNEAERHQSQMEFLRIAASGTARQLPKSEGSPDSYPKLILRQAPHAGDKA